MQKKTTVFDVVMNLITSTKNTGIKTLTKFVFLTLECSKLTIGKQSKIPENKNIKLK